MECAGGGGGGGGGCNNCIPNFGQVRDFFPKESSFCFSKKVPSFRYACLAPYPRYECRQMKLKRLKYTEISSSTVQNMKRGVIWGNVYSSKTVFALGLRYTKPGLQAEKNRAHYKYKKNIAMTDCLQAGYSITRQSVIALFFLYLK